MISTHFCSSVGGSHTPSPSGGCVVDLPAEHKCPLNYPLKNKVFVNMSVGMSVERKITNSGDFHPPAFPALAESEAFRARVPQFTGKETDYQGWKIQLIGYFRKKGLEHHLTNDTPPEPLSKTEVKAKLKRMDADLDEDSRRYTYKNGILDVEASKSKINEDTRVLVNKQNKRIADWTDEQKSVFDDLAMAVSTDGQPMKLINSVKSRYGCDAWTKVAIKVNITNETAKAKAISSNHKSGSKLSSF